MYVAGKGKRVTVSRDGPSLPTPTMSVGVGRIFESVCLFVCPSITQKRMIPKFSNLI